jgi:hypothetical protein
VPKSSRRKHEVRRANRDRRARIDELRRQQRAAERRKTMITFGSAIAVAVLLIGGVIGAEVARTHSQHQKAFAAEAAAGCLGVHNDPVAPAAIHIPDKPIDYTKGKYGDTAGGTLPIPPSGGPHNPVPLGFTLKFLPVSLHPRPERAVHNLEHGWVIVWYDSQLPASQVAQLQAIASSEPKNQQLMVVGWWQGNLPLGKHVVLTAWGRTERCSTVSKPVIEAFYSKHVNALAPEPGAGSLGGDRYPAYDLNTTPTGPTTMPSASASPPARRSSTTPTPKPTK